VTQSIELLLDDETDAAVRAQWEALKQAGLPSQARHTGATNAPHVTLAIAEQIPGPVEAALNDVADDVPLPIRLGSLLCFGGRTPWQVTLVRLVVPSAGLLSLQGRASAHLEGLRGRGAYFGPGTWTPHVTLARDVPFEHVSVALAVLAEQRDLDGEAVAVRRWDSAAKRTWLLG
jgi:2'-5' RNA ligase